MDEGEGSSYFTSIAGSSTVTSSGISSQPQDFGGFAGWESLSGGDTTSYTRDDLSTSVPVDVDEEDFDDEEIGEVPQTVDGTLAINQVYQDTMLHLIAHIEGKLHEVRSAQSAMSLSLDSNSARKTPLKIPALLYIHPYFKDSSGMAPPRNEDSATKLKLGEFDPLVQPPKKWTTAECNKLRNAVRLEILQHLSKSLKNKEELLEEKLTSTEAMGAAEMSQTMKKQLAKVRKDIKAIESQGDPVLLEDTDHVDWVKIANDDLRGTRKPLDCELKWKNELCPRWKQTEKWLPAEAALLAKTVESYQVKGLPLDWDRIAKKIDIGRTAFQCFEKYQSDLNPDMVKREWTKDEDKKLMEIIQNKRVGDFIPWDSVAYLMEGRTRAQCVSRFTRTLDPSVKRGRWSEEEDLLCIVAVQKYGQSNWGKIATMVPGRTDAQCRERWCSVLDTSIKLGEWTRAEDEKLAAFVKEFGFGKWASVSKLVPGRPPGMCKMRYLTLKKKRKQKKEAKKKKSVPDKEFEEENPGRNVEGPVRGRIQRLMERKQRVHQMYENLSGQKLKPEPDEIEEEANSQMEEFLDTLHQSTRQKIIAKLNFIQARYRYDLNKPAKEYMKEAQRRQNLQEIKEAKSLKDKEEQARGEEWAELEDLEHQIQDELRVVRKEKARKAQKVSKNATKDLFIKALKRRGAEAQPLPPSLATTAAYRQLLSPPAQRHLQESVQKTFPGFCPPTRVPFMPETSKKKQKTRKRKTVEELWLRSETPPLADQPHCTSYNDLIPRAFREDPVFNQMKSQFKAMFRWPAVLSDVPVET